MMFICPDVEQKQELVWENKGREGTCLQSVIPISSYETEGFSEYTLKLGKASLLSSFGDECRVCACHKLRFTQSQLLEFI